MLDNVREVSDKEEGDIPGKAMPGPAPGLYRHGGLPWVDDPLRVSGLCWCGPIHGAKINDTKKEIVLYEYTGDTERR